MTVPALGAGKGADADVPDEYWFLIKGRTVSSLMGIAVGVLGIRGAQSLNLQTIKLYFAGLVACAIVAMGLRIQVLFDILNGRVSGRVRTGRGWCRL